MEVTDTNIISNIYGENTQKLKNNYIKSYFCILQLALYLPQIYTIKILFFQFLHYLIKLQTNAQ